MVKSRILTLVWFLFISTLTFAAGVNVDPTAAASQQGQLLNAPNGVPIINIAPPNAKGLSHNKYHDFNVEQKGLILNNSQTVQRSQIGGVIANNPRLIGGNAASVILNEVTSSRRSSLNGPLEVHGQRADVIIANPNGINVNGGTFINTPRATLTTGIPQITDGTLQGFDVNGGDVVIEGLGLNATQTDVVDIMARSISLNAELHANTVNMVTGRNEIDYVTRAATKKADDGSTKPAFALDSSALGGMYVGRIALVGTEQGVGVNLQGVVTTNVGDMSLSADGKITLKKTTAEGAVKLNAANNDIDITEVTAKQNSELTGNVISLADQGKLEAGTELKVNGTTFNTTNAQVSANNATLNTTTLNNNNSTINVVDKLTIATNTLDNLGDIVAGGETEITATTRLTNQKRIQSGDTLKLTTALLENQTNAEILSEGAQTLTVTTLNNNGTISSNNDIDINSTTINNTGKVSADGKLNLTATTVNNTSSAKLLSQLDMQLGVTDIDNAGEIATAKNLVANVNNNLTNSGLLYSQDDMSLYVNNVLHNNEGAIYLVNGDLMIAKNAAGEKTERITNDSGIIETEVGDITLKTKVLENKRARFNIIQETSFNQTYVTQWGTLPALGSTPDFVASPAWYAYFNNYFITVPDPADPVTYNPSYYSMADDNGAPVYGQIRVQGRSTKLDSANTSAAALISAKGNLTIDVNTITNHSSQIAAGGDMNLTGNSLSNTGYDLFTNYYYMAVANDGVRRIGGRGINVNSFADLNVYKLIFSTSEGSVRSTFLAEGHIDGDFNAQIDNTNIQAFANPSDINTGVTPTSIQGLSDLLLDPATVDADPVQQALTATTHLNGLFITAPDSADYIVETRASFVDFGKFFGSDYFLKQTNYDLDDEVRFLGDAFYETKLVEQQVKEQTSQRLLYGSNGIEQMKQLLDNGAQVAANQELSFGIALTPAQIDALNSDIVWYVEQPINGKRAMVPVLYLANSTRMALTSGGALIAANDIDIDAGFGISNSGAIDALDDLVMNARIGITNSGGALTAGNDLELRSTYGDISNEGVSAISTYGARNFETRELSRGKIEAGRDVKLGAGNDIRNIASDITAGDNLKLDAGNNVLIGAREDKREYYSNVNGTHWGKFTRNATSNLNAGGNLEIDSGELTLIQGSKLKSGDNLTVRTGSELIVDTVVDTSEQEGKSEKSGGFFGGSSSRYFYRNQVTNLQAQIESGGDLNLKAQDNLALLSPQLNAEGNVSLKAVDGTVTLGSTKDSDYKHNEYNKQGFVSWKSGNEGHHLEKVRHTEITAGGDILINAGNGVVIELKHDGSLQDSIESLSQLPELAWMAELRDREDIDWKTIEEQHKYWSQHESGIGGPGLTLITIAVAIATQGAGAQLLGFEAGATLTTFEAAQLAVVDTLISQATTSFIVNGGDIGAVFKDLISSELLVDLATASLGASITNSLYGALDIAQGISLADLNTADLLKQGLIDVGTKTAIDVAVYGQSLSDSFLDNLSFTAIDLAGAKLAGEIGDTTNAGSIENIVLHGLLGCAIGAAQSGDCTSGASGAAFSAAFVPYIAGIVDDGDGLLSGKEKQELRDLTRFGAALITTFTGQDAALADVTAGNEIDNNYLNHTDIKRWEDVVDKVSDACTGSRGNAASGACAQARNEQNALETELQQKSAENTIEMYDACQSGNAALCQGHLAVAQQYQNWRYGNPFWVFDNNTGRFDIAATEASINDAIVPSNLDWGINLDNLALEVFSDYAKGNIELTTANAKIYNEIIKHDGVLNLTVGGATTTLGIVVGAAGCVGTAGVLCVAAAVGGGAAVVGSYDETIDGVQTLVLGEAVENPYERFAEDVIGLEEKDANTFRNYVDTGALVVEIVAGGYGIFKAGKLIATVGDNANDVVVLTKVEGAVELPSLPTPSYKVPNDYIVNVNTNGTATVTGPRGGVYESTGFYDSYGNPIYKSNSGSYVTLNGTRTIVNAPPDYSSIPIHHICTNKCNIGQSGDIAWTPEFKTFFDSADLNINTATENLVAIIGHRGPHPEAYHQYVFGSLEDATRGLTPNTSAYKNAVTNKLNQIKQEALTPGSKVNNWLTRQ